MSSTNTSDVVNTRPSSPKCALIARLATSLSISRASSSSSSSSSSRTRESSIATSTASSTSLASTASNSASLSSASRMLCRIARVIATHPDGTRRDGSNRTVDPPDAAPRLANRRSASSRVAASPSPSCTRAALDVDVASSVARGSLAIARRVARRPRARRSRRRTARGRRNSRSARSRAGFRRPARDGRRPRSACSARAGV